MPRFIEAAIPREVEKWGLRRPGALSISRQMHATQPKLPREGKACRWANGSRDEFCGDFPNSMLASRRTHLSRFAIMLPNSPDGWIVSKDSRTPSRCGKP